MFPTELEISITLSSKFELASDRDDPKVEVSCFKFANSVFFHLIFDSILKFVQKFH